MGDDAGDDAGDEEAMMCPTCDRVRPAGRAADYTLLRARMITQYGLCACPAEPAAELPGRPPPPRFDRGPAPDLVRGPDRPARDRPPRGPAPGA